jgi:protein-S-isoprenylcysteine O-methyltransferase Ste14
MIGLFQKIANSLLSIANAGASRRGMLTPLIGFLFVCFLGLFFLASFATDRWLNLPSIIFVPWTFAAGLILLIPGAVLWLWTVILFAKARGTPVPINPPQELVINGPYSLSRNPMMLGMYMVFFAIGLLKGSLALTVIFTPLLIIIMTIFVTEVEEKDLELKFGSEYLQYKRRVGMYFPRFGISDK